MIGSRKFEYLSDEWLSEVRSTLNGCGTGPSVIVEYRCASPRGSVVHYNVFQEGTLVEWTHERPGESDLVIARELAVDQGDLLSRMPTELIATMTKVQSCGLCTDVFGVTHGMVREPHWIPSALELTFRLRCADTPFGQAEISYSWARGTFELANSPRSPDVLIEAPFESIMGWLHDESTLIGHDMTDPLGRCHIEGDLFRLSAIEGIVSAPRSSVVGHCENQLSNAMTTYQSLRRTPALIELLNEIDGFTAQ